MRSKELDSAEALNQHINSGWILVRAYDAGRIRYLVVKDDEQEKKMVVKGARTIAEYKILKMIQTEIPDMKDYTLIMDGNEGTIRDSTGTEMVLVYDADSKKVYEKGVMDY